MSIEERRARSILGWRLSAHTCGGALASGSLQSFIELVQKLCCSADLHDVTSVSTSGPTSSEALLPVSAVSLVTLLTSESPSGLVLVLRFIPKQMLACALVDIHIRKLWGPSRDCHEPGHTGWHPQASSEESSEVPREVGPSTYLLDAGFQREQAFTVHSLSHFISDPSLTHSPDSFLVLAGFSFASFRKIPI